MSEESTTRRLQNEFLTCPRCCRAFKEPKALPCLHSLCKTCLQEHIEDEMAGDRRTSFTCPVPMCRKKIFVPDPSKPTNLWAKQFPSNYLIRGMMDTLSSQGQQAAALTSTDPASERSKRPVGQSKSLDRGQAPSSSLRRRKEQLSQKGRSVDSAAPPAARSSDSNPKVQALWRKIEDLRDSLQEEQSGALSCVKKLTRHKDEAGKEVNQALKTIEEAVLARKAELREALFASFSEELEKLSQRVQSCKDNLQSLTSCEELLRSLAAVPAGDNNSDVIESLNDQLEEIQYRPSQPNASSVTVDYGATSASELVEAVTAFGSVRVEREGEPRGPKSAAAAAGAVLFITAVAASAGANSSGRGSPSSRSSAPRASFSVSNDDGLPSYSAVSTTHVATANTPSATSASASARVPGSSAPTLVEKICPGKLSPDGQGTQIYDITVTSAGVVVMTVYGEKMVQAFRPPRLTQSGQRARTFMGRLELDTQPGCLCTISKDYVAATGENCLYLLCVAKDKLELKRTVPTGKNYQGIASYGQSTLVATCQSPAGVDLVELSGFITETIDRDRATGQLLFRQPTCVTSSDKDGLLFVIDGSNLVCLNNAGKVRYTFPKPGDSGEPLTHAHGVCCDSTNGYVYIVDRGKRRVLALSSRGTRIADAVITEEHGLTDPFAAALDSQGLLYVTNDFAEILVFKVL